jgi:hypothetical protein
MEWLKVKALSLGISTAKKKKKKSIFLKAYQEADDTNPENKIISSQFSFNSFSFALLLPQLHFGHKP